MDWLPLWCWTFAGAELFFLLLRASDITLLVKSSDQLAAREQLRVSRGLRRSVVLEALVFVPASAALLLAIAPLGVPTISDPAKARAVYALLGLASYGFPFAAIRAFVRRVAMATLKEFATITKGQQHELNDE